MSNVTFKRKMSTARLGSPELLKSGAGSAIANYYTEPINNRHITCPEQIRLGMEKAANNLIDGCMCECERLFKQWIASAFSEVRCICCEDVVSYAKFLNSIDDCSVKSFLLSHNLTIDQLILLDRLHFFLKVGQASAYYHPFCDRAEAEDLLFSSRATLGLQDSECPDGLFIIRSARQRDRGTALSGSCGQESGGGKGLYPFCLSTRCQDKCYHYRIHCSDHCMFRLEGQNFLFHGIDELIKYHQGACHGLKTALTKGVQGCVIPNVHYRYGIDNILHKCCTDNGIGMLSDIMERMGNPDQCLQIDASTCSDRCSLSYSLIKPSINDKDSKGSTLLLNAVEQGRSDIVKLIIRQPDAILTLINADGYSPIHLAVRGNDADMLRLVVSALAMRLGEIKEPATVWGTLNTAVPCASWPIEQLTYSLGSCSLGCTGNELFVPSLLSAVHSRNPYNRQLPIHQAALHNSVECVRILLNDLFSPIAPRDCNDQTPIHFALTSRSGDQRNENGEGDGLHDSSCSQYLLHYQRSANNDIQRWNMSNYQSWFRPLLGREKCDALLRQLACPVSQHPSQNYLTKLRGSEAVFLVRCTNQVANCDDVNMAFPAKATANLILSIALPDISYPDKEDKLEPSLGVKQSCDSEQNQCQVFHYKIECSVPHNQSDKDWLDVGANGNRDPECVSKLTSDGAKCLFSIGDGPYFRSLCELLSYYSVFADGLLGTLHTPAFWKDVEFWTDGNEASDAILSKDRIFKDFGFSRLLSVLHSPLDYGTPLVRGCSTPNLSENVGGDGQVTQQADWLASPCRCHDADPADVKAESPAAVAKCKHLPLIEVRRLRMTKMLGRGEFGCVWEAKYTDERDTRRSVAVKVLNDISLQGRRDFLREALIMSELKHPCLVHIHGIVNDVSLMIVQELLPKGSLLNFCKNHRLPQALMNSWAIQIASGMEYMRWMNVVHRDLAARNVLVSSDYHVKVSDFGLSRAAASNRTYTQKKFGPAPIKWYAPESIEFAIFTSKSDVWSYAVTLWEMFSAGKLPYGDMSSASDILRFLKQEHRLERPSRCSRPTYQLMSCCWAYEDKKRPNFAQIIDALHSNREYVDAAYADVDL